MQKLLAPSDCLHAQQEQQEVVPGETSGELKLLSPGEEPVTINAPKKEPATATSLSTSTGPPQSPASPFIAQQPAGSAEASAEAALSEAENSSKAVPSNLTSPWQGTKEAEEESRASALPQSQEKAQLLVGDKPGDFTVVTQEGRDIPISAYEVKVCTKLLGGVQYNCSSRFCSQTSSLPEVDDFSSSKDASSHII